MARHFMAASVAFALLLAPQLSAAQDRSEAPPPSDETTVQRTTRSGGFLPLTLFPNVGDDARAIGAGYGGYDGARDSARLQSFAEARLFGPLALRVMVQSRDVGETVSPGAMARLQLLSRAKHGARPPDMGPGPHLRAAPRRGPRHRGHPRGNRSRCGTVCVNERASVLWGRWNSAPAVTVRDPTTTSGRLTRWNSWTDGHSPDEKRTLTTSTPAEMKTSPSPALMACRAMRVVCSEEAQ